MKHQLQLRLKPETAFDALRLKIHVSTELNIDVNSITEVRVLRRSIDARQRQVMVNLTVDVYQNEAAPAVFEPVDYRRVPEDAPQAVVVGAGPAGLFAALRLIERGVRPILLERGKSVDDRKPDLARISREGIVDPDSNYCFGEGGAGAFSDGKLYTRSKKRGSVEKILRVLAQHGADAKILADAHPHIGSDRLPAVIRAIRETILACGGEVHFGCRVTDLIIEDGNVDGVRTASGAEFRGPVVLATGHSARDVYEMLDRLGVDIEAKGIAVGVRLEHRQEEIDKIFYHNPNGRGRYLPPAEYSLLTRVDGRGVYSFCMCPGGYVIPAASAPGEMVVNGMSPANRGTRWANSGMVVEILPDDIPEYDKYGPLKMMEFQRDIERRFFEDGTSGSNQRFDFPKSSQEAPAQRMTDFVEGRVSKTLPESSYTAGVHPARVDKLLPGFVASRLQRAFGEFGKKYRGFLSPEALVLGDETRTSSPVRVTRDPATLRHVTVGGLYPCGEGAGYAGGIVSAAIDGDRCADALSDLLLVEK